MKLIFAIAFASFIFDGHSQTPLISHKSHSGTSGSYLIASTSNFGAIKIDFDRQMSEPKIHQAENFIPLNDSVMVLEITDFDKIVLKRDTLPNKEKFSPMVFEFRYKDSIRKKEIEENYKREMEQEEQVKKQQLESPEQINEGTTSVKKKKRSYLLFLFGITGGGMLLMKLFSKSRITKSSIA